MDKGGDSGAHYCLTNDPKQQYSQDYFVEGEQIIRCLEAGNDTFLFSFRF